MRSLPACDLTIDAPGGLESAVEGEADTEEAVMAVVVGQGEWELAAGS